MRMFIVIGRKTLLTKGLAALAALLLFSLALPYNPWRFVLPVTGSVHPVSQVGTAKNRVALTFDVTHGEQELQEILTALYQGQVKATFFLSNGWVGLYPNWPQRLQSAGHDLGTLGHRLTDQTKLTESEAADQLTRSQNLLQAALGRPVRYYRPFGGHVNDQLIKVAQAAGLTTVTWTLDSGDGVIPPPKAPDLAHRVVSRARSGQIILLTASDFSRNTGEALPEIIQGLKQKGFQIVTLTELLAES